MKIMITSGPGRGHIHPMVPLARALLGRGDEVLWVTGPDEAARLRGDGFDAAAAGLTEREATAEFVRRYPEIHDIPGPGKAEFTFPRIFGGVRAGPMLADLVPVARSWAPDLIVSEQAEFGGPLAAAMLGIPNVCHSFGSVLPVSRVLAAGDLMAPLWVEHGLVPRLYGGCYDHLYINIYPPSLQPESAAHLSAVQDLGPSSSAITGEDRLPSWIGDDSTTPLVYVTLGTVFSNDAVLTTIVDAVRTLPVRMVVTVGPHGDPAALGEQPANVHLARYIPQDQLLPHCSVVISHCGSGTFLAALGAGLPQLCVPQAADQFINTAACVRAGAGLALEPDRVTPAGVHAAVDHLLDDPSFRTAAQKVGREISAMPSAADVAERLHHEFG